MTYFDDMKGLTKWTNLTISYTVDPVFYNTDQHGVKQDSLDDILGAPTSTNEVLAKQALDEWAKLVNFKFTPVSYDQAVLTILNVPTVIDGVDREGKPLNFTGVTSGDYPAHTYRAIFIETAYANLASSKALFMHELGHALGLDHPGHAEGNFLTTYNKDTTLMSYNPGVQTAGYTYLTPMIYDIATIQQIYGKTNINTDTSGGTLYNKSSNTYGNTKTIAIDGTNYEAFTIWDAGGNDTIDVSNVTDGFGLGSKYSYDLIDLRGIDEKGNIIFSHVGNQMFTFALDPDTNWTKPVEIENVKGSLTHFNMIIGNDANNSLTGGNRSDTISGGKGQDNIDGGADNDVLWGGEGRISKDLSHKYTAADFGVDDGVKDVLIGGAGRDTIYAGVGDSADGGAGLDHIYGVNGAQTLAGGADSDYLSGGGGADHLFGGGGQDILEFTNGAIVEDATKEDFISYAGGKQITGGMQQWWMEAGFAYYSPISSLNALGGFIPDFLNVVSIATDLHMMAMFRFALSTTGDLVIQSGRGRIGQMVIKDYDLDLEMGESTANVVAFRSVPVDGKEASLERYKELANLILHAGFGHGLPAGGSACWWFEGR